MPEKENDKAIQQEQKRSKTSSQLCKVCSLNIDTDGYASCSRCNLILHISCGEAIGKRCPSYDCMAKLVIHPGVRIHLEVSGADAHDVERVAKSVLTNSKAFNSPAKNRSSPWLSGSFYLLSAVVLLAVALVAARVVPAILLPITLVFGILSISIIGAFQLRHDSRLSEKNFFRLMLESLRSLPLLRHGKEIETNDKSAN